MKTPMYDYFMTAAERRLESENFARKSLGFVCQSNLLKSRIFKIPRELSELFLLTDAPSFDYKYMPFDNMFLEQSVKTPDNCVINAVLITKFQGFINMETKKFGLLDDDEINFIVSFSYGREKMMATFTLSQLNDNSIHKYRFIQTDEVMDFTFDLKTPIRALTNNFLCFVNSPDIEYKTVIDSKRDTEIRRRKGKPQRPPIANIVLTNPLKRYIYKQKHNEKMIYSHRFWVRGHWRTLRDKRYGENQGKKLWIKPYIKGDGLLINKKYELRT